MKDWADPKPISFGTAMLLVSLAAIALWVISLASDHKDQDPNPTPSNSSLGRASEAQEYNSSWSPSFLIGSTQ